MRKPNRKAAYLTNDHDVEENQPSARGQRGAYTPAPNSRRNEPGPNSDPRLHAPPPPPRRSNSFDDEHPEPLPSVASILIPERYGSR
eukprot:CAMPEP_0198223104 /NCGR_PEP_ID=MMETSP1445-20131203/91001_1 /TAXON_ID=36898 /ORGANISM="Pyramimonas sp., Strain CCMP2087" /LENGTH=86 /DNA_ID=CAMNT_0043901841 /DNA_START=189 /DNA_END=446 /DNA_ORIENTATION=-